jgi:L-ascorbate metabolism protein UlaG (beta-lactamase superfamily)
LLGRYDFMDIRDTKLDFLGHAGVIINSKEKKIVIDPYNISGKIEKADIVLVTHGHYDHCSIKDIEKVVMLGTVVICPADCQSKLLKIEGINLQIVEWGDVLDFGKVKIEAFPAYNIKSDNHPRSEGWLGYVVKIQGVIYYYAGDTDYIPEMQRLSGYGKHGNEFVALLPVAGNVVMNSEEAADAASVISPDIAIPISYGSGVCGTLKDAEDFVEICKERNVNACILEKI